MHVLRLKLKTNKYQKYLLGRMFYIAYKIYVLTIKYAQKQLRLLKRDNEYKKLIYQYKIYKNKSKITKEEKEKFKLVKTNLNDLIKSYNLTRGGLDKFVKIQQHKYKHILTSNQVGKIADFVLVSVEKILYDTGKTINIKKYNQFNIISQKTTTNGLKLINNNLQIFDEVIPIKYKNTNYEIKSLDNKLKYLELVRIEFNNGYEYYVNFVLDGPAPLKFNKGKLETGIDLGVSTVAAVNKTACTFEELTPKCKEYNKKINTMQKNIDKSLRAANPDLYNEDDTIKKNSKGKFKKSKHCKYLDRKRRVLYRKKKAYTLCRHNESLNKIIKDSNVIKIEDMDFKRLVKRSKNLERQDKPSVINGKEVYKFKKKKRFGKSITDRSPGLYQKRLEQKCKQYEVKLEILDTAKVKASQYEHDKDEFIKHKLSERTKLIDNNIVQRDLYSAFLIKNTINNQINKDKCDKEFKRFLKNQDLEVKRLKSNNFKNKNFGM